MAKHEKTTYWKAIAALFIVVIVSGLVLYDRQNPLINYYGTLQREAHLIQQLETVDATGTDTGFYCRTTSQLPFQTRYTCYQTAAELDQSKNVLLRVSGTD